ncbi:MAG: electron transfer flavoprotein subunit alpha/FixB family protein [Deltaproteobacteria bacterium]|nr:electron transfer flavoprotein subunit alpha/FixB family protein [Deltaproteobacteria bacterium]
MGNVVTYCEYSGSSLRGSALSALNAARQVAAKHGGQVIALLIGKGAAGAASEAKKYAAKALVVEDDRLENYLAETYAPVVAGVVTGQGASALVGAANNLGKDLFPRVAALLDAGMASDISGVVSANQFRRPILAGSAIATVEVSTPVVVLTARQSEFAPAQPSDEGAVETAQAGDVSALGAEFVRLAVSKSERPELTEAKAIVAGGRGMKSGENFRILEELADTLGAGVGASRAATDAGFVPADWQIGQTGKVVAPDLYIAVAISGAIQHLAGMKGSKVIVAINKDAEAPIFQVADYGLVSTWEKTLPELTAEIKKHKAQAH